MTECNKIIKRKPPVHGRWTKLLDFLHDSQIINTDFTGDLLISFNRGGVSGVKKIEVLK